MVLVPDSAPIFSLDENYFNVHFLEEVGQSRDIPVKMSARAGLCTKSSPSKLFLHSCVAASGMYRQWVFFLSIRHMQIFLTGQGCWWFYQQIGKEGLQLLTPVSKWEAEGRAAQIEL